MDNLTTRIRFIPAVDRRDSGGTATPFGIAFDVVGPAGRICWSVNTGIVARPILTARKLEGLQKRADRPGVDLALVHGFPQPMVVAVVVEPGAIRDSPEDPERLLGALISEGSESVFEILREVYRRELGVG